MTLCIGVFILFYFIQKSRIPVVPTWIVWDFSQPLSRAHRMIFYPYSVGNVWYNAPLVSAAELGTRLTLLSASKPGINRMKAFPWRIDGIILLGLRWVDLRRRRKRWQLWFQRGGLRQRTVRIPFQCWRRPICAACSNIPICPVRCIRRTRRPIFPVL